MIRGDCGTVHCEVVFLSGDESLRRNVQGAYKFIVRREGYERLAGMAREMNFRMIRNIVVSGANESFGVGCAGLRSEMHECVFSARTSGDDDIVSSCETCDVNATWLE